MNVEITVKEKAKFPVILRTGQSKTIVLFTSEKCGTVLSSDDYEVGHYRTDWLFSNFNPFDGVVELSN